MCTKYNMKFINSFINVCNYKTIYSIEIEDIIKDSGISRNGFKLHFKDCEDLYLYVKSYLYHRYENIIFKRINNLPIGNLTVKKLIIIMAEFVFKPLYKDKYFFKTIYDSNLSYIVLKEINLYINNYIKKSNDSISRVYLDSQLIIKRSETIFKILLVDFQNKTLKEFKEAFYIISNLSLKDIMKENISGDYKNE
ncbi:hypothetical protein [Apilactobacillus micheneri]|uniref:hypothetical protein n=1 Tax=Apilactobacillus micheneri TaxID=1899430 RepID=UPI000D51C706|nr:hypothetical protein [Apilactobacillus micheneri]GAY80304.1 hypothetical protein NBRC113063_01176 [Apilactobacillus micheneri]